MTENAFWYTARSGIELSLNEVHVWKTRLDPDALKLDSLSTFLSAEERERASQFTFEKDRAHFTVARATLRRLLGGYLGKPPKEIILGSLKNGKPVVAHAPNMPPLHFNLSHSHGLALFAFCLEHEVGVDLEKIRPEILHDQIQDRFFSTREREEFAALPLALRPEGFFLAWTRKEAYVKAHGDGLGASLRSFDVSLTPGKPAELHSPDDRNWRLYSLNPGKGFVGALVVEGQEHRMRLLEFDAQIGP